LIIRRGTRAIAGADPEQRTPKRSRAWRYILLTLGAGLISGLLAMAGIWPFSSLQSLAQTLVPAPAAALIDAHSLFPPAPVQHKVVDVYDPPPPAQQAPAPPPSSPHPTPSHSPHPPNSSPRPSPPPDD
jgi:hypothetical protein